MKKIPQYQPVFSAQDQDSVSNYMRSGGWCAEFSVTELFEKEIANIANVKHAVVMNSGTSCLAASLMALGLGAGDEVIVPNITMAGTASAVILAGATPVFVDIEPEALSLDIEKTKLAISKNTKAIIHVSLNGRGGSLKEIQDHCKSLDIPLVADAAQSMGSMYMGKPLGSFGSIAVYSFSSPKIITTGQGGVALTNSDALATALRRTKNFGREFGGADDYDYLGFNFKFTDLQAALGVSQITTISEKIALKKKIFSEYFSRLSSISRINFLNTDLIEVTPWFVDIYCENRNELIEFLAGNNIGTRKIYPPLHSQRAFKSGGEYKVSEYFSSRGLWLPSSFNVLEDIPFICDKIREFYGE